MKNEKAYIDDINRFPLWKHVYSIKRSWTSWRRLCFKYESLEKLRDCESDVSGGEDEHDRSICKKDPVIVEG